MKKQKIAFIIQARIGSNRLPGKAMIKVNGKPLLGWLVERVKPSKFIDLFVVATSKRKKDNIIIDYCKKNGISYFRGDENDVLGRIYQAAKKYKADAVLRIGPDDPFMYYSIVDKFCKLYLAKKPDYISGHLKKTYPIGLQMDMFSYKFLKKINNKVTSKYDREHISSYVLRNRKKFNILSIGPNNSYYKYRITIDYPEDLKVAKKIFTNFKTSDFNMDDIIHFLDSHPEIQKINNKYNYNEKINIGD